MSTPRLQNEDLRKIQSTLLPQQTSESITSPPQTASTNNSNQSTSSTSAEFIPHIFYALHQLTKDTNNSSYQLETATGFIRHRLRTCKSLITENEDCKKLLGKSTEEWNQIIVNRERELEIKKKVLQRLGERIRSLKEDSQAKASNGETETTLNTSKNITETLNI